MPSGSRLNLIGAAALLLLAGTVPLRAQRSPRYVGGPLPSQQQAVVGWEQAFVDLQVAPDGAVAHVTVLQTTPGFADRVTQALGSWMFQTAAPGPHPQSIDVLVALVYRPPVLYNTPTLGDPPGQITSPPPTIPFPTSTVTPMYPATAVGDGIVLVQVQVNAAGAVDRATVVGSASGFDDGARAAAARWHFRPAMVDGAPSAALAYVVFGFRQPVTTPRPSAMTSIEKSAPSHRSASGQ